MQNHTLPPLSQEAQSASDTMTAFIKKEISGQQNGIPFSRFMELVLYTPQYGYYTGGSHKIGTGGDFITAPELSPLFAQTLARQIQPLLNQTSGNLYEFGAGTGTLATGLLNALSGSINTYYIIELSPQLAERQRQFIAQNAPEHISKVVHLDKLPEHFDGVLLGNEVLDAMPVEIVEQESNAFYRMNVSHNGKDFFLCRQAVTPSLQQQASLYFPQTESVYRSELHPQQHAFIRTLAQKLQRGAMIWFDYGFDAAQYYHPQRKEGTLIGHHLHHVVHDPFFRIGLTDLTAHVNFTDIAQAGCDAGLDLIGYATQANFLINLGILELLERQYPDTGSTAYIQAAAAVQMLLAPHEMGELFKVMAFGKDIEVDWQGFVTGDICHKL